MPAIGASTTGGSATTRSERRSGAAARAVMPARLRSAPRQPGRQVGLDVVDADALLRHRVALPDGDRVVVEGLEVDGDAERRADLVLAPVATADRLRVVEVDVPVTAQRRGQVTRHR